MSQIQKKWISDKAIDHNKLDSTDSYTVKGLTVGPAGFLNVQAAGSGSTLYADSNGMAMKSPTLDGTATIECLAVGEPAYSDNKLTVGGKVWIDSFIGTGVHIEAAQNGNTSIEASVSGDDCTGMAINFAASTGEGLHVGTTEPGPFLAATFDGTVVSQFMKTTGDSSVVNNVHVDGQVDVEGELNTNSSLNVSNGAYISGGLNSYDGALLANGDYGTFTVVDANYAGNIEYIRADSNGTSILHDNNNHMNMSVDGLDATCNVYIDGNVSVIGDVNTTGELNTNSSLNVSNGAYISGGLNSYDGALLANGDYGTFTVVDANYAGNIEYIRADSNGTSILHDNNNHMNMSVDGLDATCNVYIDGNVSVIGDVNTTGELNTNSTLNVYGGGGASIDGELIVQNGGALIANGDYGTFQVADANVLSNTIFFQSDVNGTILSYDMNNHMIMGPDGLDATGNVHIDGQVDVNGELNTNSALNVYNEGGASISGGLIVQDGGARVALGDAYHAFDVVDANVLSATSYFTVDTANATINYGMAFAVGPVGSADIGITQDIILSGHTFTVVGGIITKYV